MSKLPKIENIVSIEAYRPENYKADPRGQGCITGCHIHNRAKLYRIVTRKGNEYTIHPKCYGLEYGKAGKKFLKEILEETKKPKKASTSKKA